MEFLFGRLEAGGALHLADGKLLANQSPEPDKKAPLRQRQGRPFEQREGLLGLVRRWSDEHVIGLAREHHTVGAAAV